MRLEYRFSVSQRIACRLGESSLELGAPGLGQRLWTQQNRTLRDVKRNLFRAYVVAGLFIFNLLSAVQIFIVNIIEGDTLLNVK